MIPKSARVQQKKRMSTTYEQTTTKRERGTRQKKNLYSTRPLGQAEGKKMLEDNVLRQVKVLMSLDSYK
jgi:hypothetical protein